MNHSNEESCLPSHSACLRRVYLSTPTLVSYDICMSLHSVSHFSRATRRCFVPTHPFLNSMKRRQVLCSSQEIRRQRMYLLYSESKVLVTVFSSRERRQQSREEKAGGDAERGKF